MNAHTRCVCWDASASAADPTGTSSIAAAYEADAVRRFKALRRLIYEAIVDLDVLGIGTQATIFSTVFRAPPIMMGDTVAAPTRRAFAFERSGSKVSSFMEWLRRAEDDGILDVMYGTPMSEAADRSWQNVYIETAYLKGLRDAEARGGAPVQGAFLRPTHADRAGLAYTRAYGALKGVTDEMDKRISAVLARGIAEGRAPAWIARQIVKLVDGIGIVRARLIARTETIRAHADATLGSYREAGITGVNLKAEFSTARDNRVCPVCAAMEGRKFTLKQAEGVIPIHPNCRCAWIPVVSKPERSETRLRVAA